MNPIVTLQKFHFFPQERQLRNSSVIHPHGTIVRLVIIYFEWCFRPIIGYDYEKLWAVGSWGVVATYFRENNLFRIDKSECPIL